MIPERPYASLSPAARAAPRLGVLGGSFDPPHAGHLHVAEGARDAFALDHVVFVPAARPPHKLERVLAPDRDRVALLELLIEGLSFASIWTGELARGGPSYTLDTLHALDAERGGKGELFLVFGSDNLPGFPRWRGVGELLELATPLVVFRRGTRLDVEGLGGLDAGARERLAGGLVEIEPFDASSSELRARLAAGEAPGDALPPPLREYARARGIYSSP